MNSAIEYFGTDFVEKIQDIFEDAERDGKFIFIHGTYSCDEAISIALNGLECHYPELLYTAELMNKNDKLLFDKLKSWPHWNLKYLVMLCIPKEAGKDGLPIWNKNKNGQFCVPSQLIRGVIDVNEKMVILNPRYNSRKKIEANIEDRSFEPNTGRCIEISIPPDEQDLYEESLEDKGRE